MKKVIAIALALCIFAVFVSTASANCYGAYCPTSPITCNYQSLDSTNTQLDQTNGINMIGQSQVAHAESYDGYNTKYGFPSGSYVDGTLTSSQRQTGTLTDNTAVASQYSNVKATGFYAKASTTQNADITVGKN
jgi:hypothetical protein